MFLTAPVLLVAHSVTITFVVRTEHKMFKHYFSFTPVETTPVETTSASIHWYRRTFSTTLVLFALGVCFLLVNLFSEGLFDASNGCTDPFIRASIAPIGSWQFSPLGVGLAYQWLFVLYSSTLLVAGFCLMTALLDRDNPRHRAASVYRCICVIAKDPAVAAARKALQQWQAGMLGYSSLPPGHNLHATPVRVSVWRRMLFYLFHLPVLLFVSLPAIGFVSLSLGTRTSPCM